jgi:hypothetical protein
MAKELFNQTVQTSIASRTTKVLAFGEPAQSGCENITIENFCKNEIGLTGVTGNVPFLDNSVNKLAFEPVFTYDNVNNRLAIGVTSTTFTLSLGQDTGKKLALYDSGTGADYGFGIQSALLQIFTPTSSTRVGIGYGTSASFTETLSVKGANIGIGTTSPTSKVTVYSSTAVETAVQIGNSATGIGVSDGTKFLVDSSGNSIWDNQENTNSYIKVVGLNKVNITPTFINFYDSTGAASIYLNLDTSTLNNLWLGNSETGSTNTVGVSNTSFGVGSGKSATGSYNCFFGFQSGYLAQGTRSTLVGAFAGAQTGLATRSNNVCIGYSSGRINGGSGVYVGHEAGYYETGADKLFIDNQARVDEASARTAALIYGVFNTTVTSQYVTINGDFNVRHKVNLLNNLGNYADDTAAAAGGIAVNQLYRNGSVVMIRVV